jgi:phytoene dehydrogenase-like protein
MPHVDVAVVGSGPNGLAAAVEVARAGRSVLVVEAAEVIGGGTRTAELTLPGFRNDVCSSVHPTGAASPFFESIGLDVEWIRPEIAVSHPLGDGRSVGLFDEVDATVEQFDRDAGKYRKLIEPMVNSIDDIVATVLGPMRAIPTKKAAFARLAVTGALPMSTVIAGMSDESTKALLSGIGAHAIAPLSQPATAGVGLFLGALGHTHGWPVAKGGSSAIPEALGADIQAHGGAIETGREISSIEELDADAVIFDTMPDAVIRLARDRLDSATSRRMARWTGGSGVCKVDWALDGPIPWLDELSPRSATVHVGGSASEIAAAEREVHAGRHPERPFIIVTQPTTVDPSRAPKGKHTAWGYCHVPSGSEWDMSEIIESQIERFAPGFKDLVLARSVRTATGHETYNANYVGGDIGGGRFGIRKVLQMGASRPFTLGRGLYLGSAAVPPGAGVHGMCGSLAAQALLANS